MIEPARPAIETIAVGSGVAATVVTHQAMFLGIPAGVLLAAFAGALFGLAYTQPESWGRLLTIPPGSRWARVGWVVFRAGGLLTTVAGIALLSGWSPQVIPHVPGFGWAKEIPPVPFAGFLAFTGQRFIPRGFAAVERWLDNRGAKA